MNIPSFLALDLAGEVHHAALCHTLPSAGVDNPGWLIRAGVQRMHSWLACDSGGDENVVLRERLAQLVEDWKVRGADVSLVRLTSDCELDVFSVAEWLDCSAVVLPRGNYVVSPRGIALARKVMDYVYGMPESTWPGLAAIRDAFVKLMEEAADDVQADGLEQDDSFLDRFAEIRVRGAKQSLIVPVETTSNSQWLIQSWQAASADLWGRAVAEDTVEVIRLLLRCVVEPAVAPISTLAATDGHLERARVSGTAEPSYARAKLLAGDAGAGPVAIVDEQTSIRIPKGWAWQLNQAGHLFCRVATS